MTSTYKIQNIVATTSLEKPIPLTKLARTQPNTEYNPETFPGLVLRIKEPKSAVLVFSSGNLVCTGTKSIAQVKKVIQAVIRQLRKINVNITTKPKITVQNIVASGTINLLFVILQNSFNVFQKLGHTEFQLLLVLCSCADKLPIAEQ